MTAVSMASSTATLCDTGSLLASSTDSSDAWATSVVWVRVPVVVVGVIPDTAAMFDQ